MYVQAEHHVGGELEFHASAGARHRDQILSLGEQRDVAQRLIEHLGSGSVKNLNARAESHEGLDAGLTPDKMPQEIVVNILGVRREGGLRRALAQL